MNQKNDLRAIEFDDKKIVAFFFKKWLEPFNIVFLPILAEVIKLKMQSFNL